MQQITDWVCGVGRPICGLQLHRRISLGRLETACNRGRLWEPQWDTYSLVKTPSFAFRTSFSYQISAISDGEHDGHIPTSLSPGPRNQRRKNTSIGPEYNAVRCFIHNSWLEGAKDLRLTPFDRETWFTSNCAKIWLVNCRPIRWLVFGDFQSNITRAFLFDFHFLLDDSTQKIFPECIRDQINQLSLSPWWVTGDFEKFPILMF